MTPHYDLKQQKKQQWCLGVCAGRGEGGSQTFLSYIWGWGGSSMFFQRDWGGGSPNVCLPHENVTARTPPPSHLVINDSSLNRLALLILFAVKHLFLYVMDLLIASAIISIPASDYSNLYALVHIIFAYMNFDTFSCPYVYVFVRLLHLV